MPISKPTFSEPEIVTSNDLKHRSYVTFHFNGERIREYNAKCIGLDINPNRAKSIQNKKALLKKLQFEIHKGLENELYNPQAKKAFLKSRVDATIVEKPNDFRAVKLLFDAIRLKIKSDLSRTYKRDLKGVYRQFRNFMTEDEKSGSLTHIKIARIETFLSQFGSSGTYYMNKRRNLSILFSYAGKMSNEANRIVKETSRRKQKAKLHKAYDKMQLKPIFEFLKSNYPNLHLCCLLTYSSWLRPHEEIRLLTAKDFKKDNTEIHLSGNENKGGKVRVVYVPDYVRTELEPILSKISRNDNIFTLSVNPLNEYYFNTQWARAWTKMFKSNLVYENQTIYSFRHTAAIDLYRRTKDVYLLQKLLGHSTIVVTLNI